MSEILQPQFDAFLASQGLGSIPFPTTFWRRTPTNRQYLMEFYTQKMEARYAQCRDFLKNTVGVKAVISGMNFWDCTMVASWRAANADAVETHSYYQYLTQFPSIAYAGGPYGYNPTKYRRLTELIALGASTQSTSYPGLSLEAGVWQTVLPHRVS